MPRGIPNHPKKRRRRASANGEATAAGETELDDNGQPVVAGEHEEPPTLGEAIEIVRSTLAHFDDQHRKRVVRAANMLLKD